MATFNYDCVGGGTIHIVNSDSAAHVAGITFSDSPTERSFLVPAQNTYPVPCVGEVVLDDEGATGIVFSPTVHGFPYEQSLMGLAGIVAAAFVAYAISRAL